MSEHQLVSSVSNFFTLTKKTTNHNTIQQYKVLIFFLDYEFETHTRKFYDSNVR